MKRYFLFLLLSLQASADEPLDLEQNPDPFVLEVKKIEVPGFPYAFNPSIVPYQGHYLMSFREIPDPKNPYTTFMGIVRLDENFQPMLSSLATWIGDIWIVCTFGEMRQQLRKQ